MKNHKQKFVPNPSEVSILHALTYGNAITRLSFIICGLANFLHKQFLKGIVFLGLEVAYFVYMIRYGITHIGNFITLGEQTQAEVFNPELGIYEYVAGDNSMLFLLYGVITIFITLAFFVVMSASAKSAYNIQVRKSRNQPIATLRKDLASLKQENLHKVMLFIPIIGILMFTIIPLVYMILIAFTSYDHNHQPPGNLFDWVGFSNFTAMFAQGGKLAGTFWPVLGWTIIWAISATVTCFLFGTMLALLINRKDTKLKSMWRFLFVLSIAVPHGFDYHGLKSLEGKRIATSYPRILSRILTENNVFATPVVVSGSVEITVDVGIADAIADLVSTGTTLKMNGLEEAECIYRSSAIMIANPDLDDEKRALLTRLLERIDAVMMARHKKYILFNLPEDKLDEAAAVIGGMKSPTVTPLMDKGWVSVQSAVDESRFWAVFERLRALGAEGILVMNIEKMAE